MAATTMTLLLSLSLVFWLIVNLFTFGFILLFCRDNYHPTNKVKAITTAASKSSRHLTTHKHNDDDV